MKSVINCWCLFSSLSLNEGLKMKIKIYLDSNRVMLVKIDDFKKLEDLADKYNRWEYVS